MIQPLMADTELEHLRLLDNPEECVICLDKVSLNSYAKPGNERDWDKRYHVNCLDKWFRYSTKGIVSDDPEDCYIVFSGLEPTEVVPLSRHREGNRLDDPVNTREQLQNNPLVIDVIDQDIAVIYPDNRSINDEANREHLAKICTVLWCLCCIIGIFGLGVVK